MSTLNFPLATLDELSHIARHIGRKSSSLHPLPSNVFLSQLDLLLPVLHDIANRSLESNIFPHSLKWAVVTPLLKKASLNHEVLRNYRPISNLNVVSKIVEKVVASRLNDYLVLNHLDKLLQSAYKRFTVVKLILFASTIMYCVLSTIIAVWFFCFWTYQPPSIQSTTLYC